MISIPMDDIHLLSSPSTIKPTCSPLNAQRPRSDAASAIQQSDVSSSRPALLAHDALGPLLFEALDGFFFTINHNFEVDFISDNVGQYLKFSQEELAGRSLYQCVHPNDVSEFSKAWAKKDAGDTSSPLVPNDQQNAQSRGRTFLCRIRTSDDSTPYIRMIVSVALHRDSLGSDKTFLICIARRPSLNDPKDKPSLLGFDQFSSRINLNYDIQSLDASHMKCEAVDMNFSGKNFRDFVHVSDVPVVERHFQEVVETGEAKSAVYRFCLHDDVYAFINTRSKVFANSMTDKSDSILSTHTIVRLIEHNYDLNGNACTRLMKSIISSNRDLQRTKQATPPKAATNTSPTAPIGTQFALTMLGMHKNASNSLQQHVSSTLGTLIQVQNSFSTPNQSSPHDKSQTPAASSPRTSQNRFIAQKSSLLDNVSSSDTVEFGSKQKPLSPSFESTHSNHAPLASPLDSLDMFLPSSTPTPNHSDDVHFPLSSAAHSKSASSLFHSNDTYCTSASPKVTPTGPFPPSQSRSSTRLRQLLANKSPSANETPSQTLHYHPEDKLDELLQEQESPSTTHISPPLGDLSSLAKRRSKPNLSATEQNSSVDMLLKKILGRQNSASTSPSRPESNHSDDSSNASGATNKQRSDIFLRTLLNDEVRPQKVIVEAPFVYGTRNKFSQRGSFGSQLSMDNNKPTTLNLKSQLSLQLHPNPANDLWTNKNKKKQRQHSNSFGNQNNLIPRKPGRPKREPSEYLLGTPGCQTPQSILSDGSLDALLDSTMSMDHSPLTHRRGTRAPSTSNSTQQMPNFKRSADSDDHLQNPRKYPKLLTQALRDDIKIECQDHPTISPSTALAATRPLHQPSHPIIKTEPEIFEDLRFTKAPAARSVHPSSLNSQSTLLRALIRTPQTPTLPTKKDAPLYDLLQNLDHVNPNDMSLFSSTSASDNNLDPLEQYLTPVLSQTSTMNPLAGKDDYLATLLTIDPKKPSEIPLPSHNKSHSSNDSSRISAIAHELLHSTTNVAAMANSQSNDDFLSLLENKDFLECLNESSTIDSILSQNSTSVIEPLYPSTMAKRSEKDEKAISEIYKTLMTSFNPGQNQQSSTASALDSLSVDNNSFNLLPGDFFSPENNHSIPPNRTAGADPSVYRQSATQASANYSYPSNNTQYSDCLPMDILDTGAFPPNVTLSPMNGSYLSPAAGPATPMMNNNPMMMYPQTPSQHHSPSNGSYRPPQHQQQQQQQQQQPQPQPQQQPLYNNYMPPHSNPMTPGYYSMPSQPRMASANTHPAQLAKRQNFMHHQQQQQQQQQQHLQQQRPPTPMNQQQQQLQLHMSMNVTLPHMNQNQQQHQQQQQQMVHRPMMNSYNDFMMSNTNGSPLQPEYHHQYPTNNPLDLPYSSDLFMSPSSNMGQQPGPNRHMNMMQQATPQQQQQQQQAPSGHPHCQPNMHQQYPNMSVALSATIQQNSHNPNNLMNPSVPSLTPAECRQSEELNNQMMNCLSFQPARCTSEFVRKQLQSTIHGRQKPPGGKDLSGANGPSPLATNLESNQKGAYFRSQLSSQLSTPPLPTNLRSQAPHQGKPV